MRYGNVELHNIVETPAAEDGRGVDLLRIPDAVRVGLNDGAKNNACLGAGAEIRFNLPKDATAKVVLETQDDNIFPPLAMVFQGEYRCQTVVVEQRPTEIVVDPAQIWSWDLLGDLAEQRGQRFDGTLTRILLPHLHRVRLIEIDGPVSPPRDGQVPATRYLSYGSSITHGAHAVCPTGSYAMQTAKHLGADLVNLGFGGGAHMEETLARHIAERTDWDFATLEMGINVGGWPTEKFRAAVETFVGTIARANADKWIFCIDLFTYAGDLNGQGDNGFRDAVAGVVGALNMPKVVHLDGRELLTDITGLRFELVHPSDDGMIEMGRNLAAAIRREMGRKA